MEEGRRVQEKTQQVRFEQIVLPHLDAAYNLARWLTRNDQDAENVVVVPTSDKLTPGTNYQCLIEESRWTSRPRSGHGSSGGARRWI